MGRNGMGKTTTINSVLGLARPRAGAISFGGARSPACGRTASPGWASGSSPKDGVAFPT